MQCPVHSKPRECAARLAKATHDESQPADLSQIACPFERIKVAIVRLRRKIDVDASWRQFQQDVQDHMADIVKHANSRWLVSILDTYADYGTPQQQAAAMIGVMMINCDRFQAAVDGLQPFSRMWDGLRVMGTGQRADAHRHMFRRIGKVMQQTPEIAPLFSTVLNRGLKHDRHMLNRLNQVSKRDVVADVRRIVDKQAIRPLPPSIPLNVKPAKQLTAIVISINYSDMLTFTLPSLKRVSGRVIVVTEEGDDAFELARRLGCEVVASKRRQANGLPFDKGALLDDGLQAAGEGWVLLTDADCVHSPGVAMLPFDAMSRNVLYGSNLWRCDTEDHWRAFAEKVRTEGKWTPPAEWHLRKPAAPIGAFQLFYRPKRHKHPEGLRLSVDRAHRKRFKRHMVIRDPMIAPVHMFESGPNHGTTGFVAPDQRVVPRFERPEMGVI